MGSTDKNKQVVIPIEMGLESIKIDQKPTNISSKIPEISEYSPSINKPPKYPTSDSPLTRRTSIKRKARFDEPSILDSKTLEDLGNTPKLEKTLSFKQNTPKTVGNSGRATKDNKKKDKKLRPDEKEVYKKITSQLTARNRRKMTIKFSAQLFVFLLILACLLSSLLITKFKGKLFLGVLAWKWFVFVMATFSGLLLTKWFVNFVVFLIEWKFLLTKNVVYFTHGLKDNVVVFLWFAVILGTWLGLLKPDVKTDKNKKVIHFISMTLITFQVGSFLWLAKTTMMKILASSFHMNRFFDRIQEAVFQHYVLQTLSGSPVVELARRFTKDESCIGQATFVESVGDKKEKKTVDWTKIHQMKQEKIPSWTMKLLVDVVSNSGLSTMSDMLNEGVVEGGVELDDNEITSEEAAIATAVQIFKNVTGEENASSIKRTDLHRFMIWAEVALVWQFFEINENGEIDLKSFCKWLVTVYKDRQALQHALNDNKTAVDELNKMLIGIVIILMIILWLLITEIATTKLLVFLSSQLIVAAFIFGNTCKTTFEAMIFVFVMHPFDVSDRCIIDGQMLVVEEMNILTTVFLRPDKEKVMYPNSVLATKAIGNYYRSPNQGDTLEFAIDYKTPLPKIKQLEEHIKLHVEQNPQHWHPSHALIVKEIENVNKIKMILFFNHTINFQDYIEKLKRRSVLVLGLKTIFDTLDITYHLLPQQVLLSNIPTV